CVQAIAFPPRF
nr:immunoglobulin light chain junction region [Macaca mulatta]